MIRTVKRVVIIFKNDFLSALNVHFYNKKMFIAVSRNVHIAWMWEISYKTPNKVMK
jgi:hypothetical protein